MERLPQYPEEGEQQGFVGERDEPDEHEQADQQLSESDDRLALLIGEGLEAAERETRPIDDLTASLVADRLRTILSEAQPALPALDALVVCGAVIEDDLYQELYADLDGQTPDVQQFVDSLHAYGVARENKNPVSHWGRDAVERETASGIRPEIWIGSLSDYTAGVLHGVWVDAWQEADQLREQAGWVIRTSVMPDAEEYAIFDHSEFCGLEISEYMSLEDVSRLAQGIAKHGEAFAAWAGYLGLERIDEVERTFEEAYLGHYESMEAYVQRYLDDGDAYRFLELVPEWLKAYVKVDTGMLGRDWEGEVLVVEAMGGGVMVFETHM